MSAILPTYARFDVTIKEATGCMVKDIHHKTYLDCTAGIGVCNLGHRHPAVQKAVEQQLDHYWHTSNLYKQPIQEQVASQLTDQMVGDYVFFANSGAEANEAAIKLARKATGKSHIITCKQSFHGRTFATMTATGQSSIHDGFGPLLASFSYAAFNDMDDVKRQITHDTAAIMIELIQGEGGVIPGEQSFLTEVEAICKENDMLLIVDEIQTGIGRTGTLFAYEQYSLSPDVITLAKGLGNGLPVGAMIAKERYKDAFGPGSHGSTFGGNPLAMAAAQAVLTEMTAPFLNDVQAKGTFFKEELEQSLAHVEMVKDIRGVGLMIGIECHTEVAQVIQACIKNGLLVLAAGPTVIRLLPPLTMTVEEIKKAITLITKSFNEIESTVVTGGTTD